MDECNVMKSWDEKCKNECVSVRLCEQIREVCSLKGGGGVDKCYMTLFNKEECSLIIEFLCTG